jgi:rod shape-determining protein MreB and related proteins
MRLRGNVAIDLGTVNTLVWVAGRGIVLEEPTAIAIDTAVGKVAAVGRAADALADKEPQDIEVIHPLRDGVIADLDAAAEMLHRFLRKARRAGGLVRGNALVCVPSGATPVERRSIVAALSVRRPRFNVRLIDEPVAAAAGAGFDLTGGAGGFVVDIGGGTTEIAAVAGWRVVRAQSLRKAGNAMDEAITQAVRNELSVIISQRAARQLKTTLGVSGGGESWEEVVGLDVAHRSPRTEYVPGSLVAAALEPIVATIAASVHEMLSDIPAGLAEDVVRGKIRLAGGGALLPGLANRIEIAGGIGAVVVEDPLRCVVRGAAEILERKDKEGIAGPGLRQLVRLRALALLEHRQDVARGVLEPGDVRSAGPVDAPVVLAHPLVPFQLHAAADQLVHGRVDVVHDEVQDRVVGRHVIGLGVHQRVPAARQVQPEQPVLDRRVEAKRLAVERPGRLQVVDGEPAERPGVLKHGILLLVTTGSQAAKLGIRPGQRVHLYHPPPGWALADPPPGLSLTGDADGTADLIIAFFTTADDMAARLDRLARRVFPAGALWVAWPRRAGGHHSDITDNVIRSRALPIGLVDVKVAAIDEDWSGLRLVWRADRRSMAGMGFY